ncbi:terminase large subunit domain-containing protein [Streptomyces hydrogenans]|uniref:terminase large subunit domain-containing protein n=1 Tax=Streptomyces hydrogenans TaxID=1873719 RepID=UPI0037F6A6FA
MAGGSAATTAQARPGLLLAAETRLGKSTSTSALAVHRALTRPGAVVVAIAPTQRQAVEIVAKGREHLRGLGIKPVRDAQTTLVVPGGGRVVALPGTAGSVRGYAASLVLIDEAAWVAADCWTAVRPMVAATNGDIIALSTPNGQSGEFWRAWDGAAGSWWKVRVPWHESGRLSRQVIEEERATLSADRFAAEYECEFTTSSTSIIRPEWIETAVATPVSDAQRAMADRLAEIMGQAA